ncbi:MAG: hypothetical protein ACLGIK_12445, partial [Gemmatimonadota bacterium]
MPAALAMLLVAPELFAQSGRPGANGARPRPATRAYSLYVSADPADRPQRDHAADLKSKARIDSIYAARSAGVMDFKKVTYRSAAGDMDIPAYLFQPLDKRGARGHAAMIWVHGGVHG